MELVEGETLAERIATGPIPIEKALPLFEQIAEGLEAALTRRACPQGLEAREYQDFP